MVRIVRGDATNYYRCTACGHDGTKTQKHRCQKCGSEKTVLIGRYHSLAEPEKGNDDG